ncbi:MAG: hypothetical protein ACOC5U_04485, partial [Candidatus Aminicenantaceae bacterium]
PVLYIFQRDLPGFNSRDGISCLCMDDYRRIENIKQERGTANEKPQMLTPAFSSDKKWIVKTSKFFYESFRIKRYER